MKEMEKERIKQIIERYLNGETTNKEERVLRDFFSRNHAEVPPEWMVYRAMFGYVARERNRIAAPVPARRVAVRVKRAVLWAAVAAAVAVFAVLMLRVPSQNVNYAFIDGKRITDQRQVMEAATEALEMVSCKEDDAFAALRELQQINDEI